MLLQQILTQLDAELDRLQTLRNIVAGLHHPKSKVFNTPEPPQAALPQVKEEIAPQIMEQPAVKIRARGRHFGSQGPRRARQGRPVETTALTSAIPAGPVIVSPGDVARERDVRAKARVAAAHSEQDAPSADAQSRDLSARWLTGTARLTI